MAQLTTEYGYFSDDGSEYIITRPDTPMPWINVLSNGDYGLTLSQVGSGYSWRTHASLNRLTRWEQDLLRDAWGKYLYLRDLDSGEVWSLSYQPCGKVEGYRVRHGFGYSVLENRYGGIHGEVTTFIPCHDPCEVWLVELTNPGPQTRRLGLYSYFEWGLGAAPDWHREFHKLFIRTDYDHATGTLLASKLLWELPGTHWNRSWPYVAFHGVSHKPSAFESDKHAFIGRHGDLKGPQAVLDGKLSGSYGRFVDAIGSLSALVELPPGGSQALAFTLGAADSREQALALATRYHDVTAARRALDQVQAFWRELHGGLTIVTPDVAANLMTNGWLQYQAIAGRLWGRSAYYQTGGAYGFRDQLQDSLVWLLLGRPEQTLKQIRLHARHQYQEGRVLHWWHPLSETGSRSNYSDDLLWLPLVVMNYLHETGDAACLSEVIPYYDEGAGTLLEHCLRAFELALSRLSGRGLPLILEADWNDGLNGAGRGGKGESVWMAHFLYYLLCGWQALGVLDPATSRRFADAAARLAAATNRYGWDGAWYARATTDDGEVLGSRTSAEGKIFLNAQTWAVLSGIAPEERARQALGSAREQLYTDYGPLLLAPAYTEPSETIGYLSRYAPGARENGGVYVHAACWAVLAERRLNGVDAAYALWQSFCPARRGSDPERYAAEPYVMPGNVAGPLADVPGRAGWTWYTGSAQWYLRAFVEGVLGLEATYDGLRLNAALPEGWDEVRVKRVFRGASYEIHIRRAGPDERGGLEVDGSPCEGPLLPIAAAGRVQRVEARV
jgi:cellobiose phosphorylase